MSEAKKGLVVETEASAPKTVLGMPDELEESVVLVLKPGRLPRAVVTDARGVARHRSISFVDLLGTLERSSVVSRLEQDQERRTSLPQLPAGTVLCDVLERAGGNSYAITGTIAPAQHLFVLTQNGATSTHLLGLPRVVYRVLWHEAHNRVSELSVAMCSPTLTGEPTADTTVYRWPFSNVYPSFSGVREGVCWYEHQRVELDLHEAPDKLVRAFVQIPNDADRYAGDLTHAAPYGGYKSFVEAVEQEGGMPHDWLKPAGLTIRELHEQKGRHQV